MEKRNLWAVVLLFTFALAVSGYHAAAAPPGMDGLAAVAVAQPGSTWVAVAEDNAFVISLLDENGTVQSAFSLSRKSGEAVAQIDYMAADAQGNVYILKSFTDSADGQALTMQELSVYTPGFLPFGRIKTLRLEQPTAWEEGEALDIRYQHIYVSTSVVLTGVSADGAVLVREAYDTGDLLGSGKATVKSLRSFPADPAKRIYRAVPAGNGIAFLTMTGEVYGAAEEAQRPVLLYPGPQARQATYASFIRESATGQVIVGEQNTGGVLRLAVTDGSVSYIMEGNRPIGTLSYTGGDILEMSFCPQSEASWAASVLSPATGADEIIVCNEGGFSLITGIRSGFVATAAGIVWRAMLLFLALLAAVLAALGIYRAVAGSRRILVKLTVISIPLLLLTLTLFGAYSYSTYRELLQSTYETKAADQGNLLRALFGSASFDSITAPQLYGSVEYDYLRLQMDTRDVYTSSAYFVDGRLYTGVDSSLPCLYPFGIRHSTSAWSLYRTAALAGRQQAGVVADRLGERIVCITPVGSSSGDTVFLLETGVFLEEINRQTSGYLRNYLLISALCILFACALLMAAFLKILNPLREIIEGLDQFSTGDRAVRLSLQNTTSDELADIARVFNKMARDIDVQIYNLRAMGDTYYKFVPRQFFRLLGKENLADIGLGSAVEGKYCVLVANLYPRQGKADFESAGERLNRFFAIIHRVAGENGATLISDSAGLRDLRLICPDGDSAARAAMDAIAHIDGHNAKCPLSQRMDVSFFLHYTQIGFGVCGDSERYVPAMVSDELDEMLALCDEFRRLSSRLIVTRAAYERLDADRHFHRFIGSLAADGDLSGGLYDFYDSSSPDSIRLLNDTLGAFNKAMELYGQNRYYDAKNIFAVVLRENQYDNVARHYVFRCEKKL